MHDVVIAGAGPAGAIAGLVLARAGARVLMVDRSAFPRHKLCGDTLNPGAIAFLHELGLDRTWEERAAALRGMRVTGPGARIEARYPDGVCGRAIERHILDAWLLDQATAAGVEYESGLVVQGAAISQTSAGAVVSGLRVRTGAGASMSLPARMTIAAEGRRSPTALSMNLLRQRVNPRRWAYGTYAEGVSGTSDLGEMHVRDGRYIGIAPLGSDIVNICVVTSDRDGAADPRRLIIRALESDPVLRERIARAKFEAPVHVLGPLAVDAREPGARGLLLAGDAAGFVDPMTGDGLHLAMRGARLAAHAAIHALESGDFAGAVSRLAEARRSELAPKLRFNRALRSLVDSKVGLRLAACGAAIAPFALGHLILRAGDAA